MGGPMGGGMGGGMGMIGGGMMGGMGGMGGMGEQSGPHRRWLRSHHAHTEPMPHELTFQPMGPKQDHTEGTRQAFPFWDTRAHAVHCRRGAPLPGFGSSQQPRISSCAAFLSIVR